MKIDTITILTDVYGNGITDIDIVVNDNGNFGWVETQSGQRVTETWNFDSAREAKRHARQSVKAIKWALGR